jgi:hypothetical protein
MHALVCCQHILSARFLWRLCLGRFGVPGYLCRFDQLEHSPPPPLGHGSSGFSIPSEISKMKTWNQFLTERYRPLESNLTDTKPLLIDTEANSQDILECAVQRLRASSDLLRTLYCLNFKQADVEDIPHITHALYLLTQDGCDLLQVAQQRMLNWKAPA